MPLSLEQIKLHAQSLVVALANADKHPEVALAFPKKIGYLGTIIEFDAEKPCLRVSIYVTGTWWKTATEEIKVNFRKTARALNDPAIGGKYDRAGAIFQFDEAEGFYLIRIFALPDTTEESFLRDVGTLRNIAAKWTMEWFFEVAQRVHSKK